MDKEKYQWALYIKALPKDKLRDLIEAFKGNIGLGINVAANKGMLKFAQECLFGVKLVDLDKKPVKKEIWRVL